MRVFVTRRWAAVCLVLAMVLLLTPLGVNRSIARQSRLVRQGFTEGVYLKDEGYTSAAIYNDLKNICDDAMELSSVLANYGGGESILTARRALVDAMQEADIPACSAAFTALVAAAEEEAGPLDAISFSDRDLDTAREDLERIRGAAAAIRANPYNETVHQFEEEVLNAFPTRFFRPVLFCELPAAFE